MTHRIASGLTVLMALLLTATAAAQATPAAPLQAHPAASAPPAASAAAPPPGAGRAATAATVAPRREYEIEIIVFRALKALGSPEDWQAEVHMSPHVSGAESPTGSGVGQLVQVLSPASYQLDAIWNALRTSADYAPVAHAAWIQTASDWGTHAGFSLRELGVQVPGLRGLVYFERGTYLHLGLTLDYTMQHPPAGLGAAPGTTFVMNETRRIRFYQRNYFDHPAFGVIALVLPVHRTPAPAP